jgi:hypothetical protein
MPIFEKSARHDFGELLDHNVTKCLDSVLYVVRTFTAFLGTVPLLQIR